MPRIPDKTPKTREDVEKLKRQWVQDPIWDLEHTEGFEPYHNELLIYRLEMEKRWLQERYDALHKSLRTFVDAFNALKGAL